MVLVTYIVKVFKTNSMSIMQRPYPTGSFIHQPLRPEPYKKYSNLASSAGDSVRQNFGFIWQL